MIKIENTVTPSAEQWRSIILGARNPLNSWDKSDTVYDRSIESCGELPPELGENDYSLLMRLAKAGTTHAKYRRMITVYADITAPFYWWKEMDTYKIGTVSNGCSTMHCLTKKPFEVSDFSFEHLVGVKRKEDVGYEVEYSDTDYKNEEWRTIDGHTKYQVSNLGRIRDQTKGAMRKPTVNSSNYKKTVMDGKNLYIHRLVAIAFIDNPDNLPEVNHKDGNKWNNKVDNLEWVSKSDNAKHAVSMGLRDVNGYTRYKVAKSSRRFSPDEEAKIREMYESGMTKQEISNVIGCANSVIGDLINGNTYNKIKLTPYDRAKITVDTLNELRDEYLKTKDKELWYAMIQLLPSSYNQKRTMMLNYEVLAGIYPTRKDHKLDEWHVFCDWIKKLPYSELIIGANNV